MEHTNSRMNMSVFTIKSTLILIFCNFFWIAFYLTFIHFMESYLKIPWLIIYLLGWLIWYFWHSVWFNYLSKVLQWLGHKNYFKFLVYGQISPGVSFFAAMMLFPALYAYYEDINFTDNSILILFIVCLCFTGFYIIFLSFRTIGLGGAAFENDYGPEMKKKSLNKKSIYGVIRHPLFLGAILISIGISLIFPANINLIILGINLATLPIYKWLEEKRLLEVFGEEYRQYMKEVNGFIPKLNIIKELLKFNL